MDILTGKKFVANKDFLVTSFSQKEVRDRVKGVDGWYRYLVSCEYYLNRVYENMVQHPSNDISIGFILNCVSKISKTSLQTSPFQ